MKPKALIILSPGFAADESDTACLPPQQVFVKALKQTYPDTHLIVLSFHYPFRRDNYNWHGVQIVSFNGKDWGKGFRLLTWTSVWRQLQLLNKQYRLLGILSFWLGECAYVGKRFAKKHQLKHHIWLLGQDAKAGNRFFKRVNPMGDDLIALSDFVADSVDRHYGIRPQHTIPVGIEADLFSDTPVKRHIDILGAGSLIPLKQYHLLIETVRLAVLYFPKLRVVLCGKGPEENALRDLISQYKLENNINLLGEVPHQEVIRLMGQSRVFVHPSEYEGFGSVLAEALYAGAHVVSFCKPMNVVADQHHVVADINEMQRRVIGLLQQPKLKHERILLYSIESIAQQVMELYQTNDKSRQTSKDTETNNSIT
ncbi:glycosyltransferase family 4 protein [Mucilaginibacter agri]|uniref:Glycosyltransferase n=1 Tax=Mucilaginibacter agri TaxID=2695265 RepID=A0A965ZF43_9SPHI|nr:glycosyltransferase family 4 protein [Mucilaginibacter agri]NCD69058.1 glycosyltransferase [Mucilaginibacter agri]